MFRCARLAAAAPHARFVYGISLPDNGAGASHGNGLIGALLHYGLPTIGADEKDVMRDLIMRGGPWSDDEVAQIFAYCESDVDALLRLLGAMLPMIAASPRRFGQALLRGRYMTAVGTVENNGIPRQPAPRSTG